MKKGFISEDWGCSLPLEQGLDYTIVRVSVMPGQSVDLTTGTGRAILVGLDGFLTVIRPENSVFSGPEKLVPRKSTVLLPQRQYTGKAEGEIPAELLLIQWT